MLSYIFIVKNIFISMYIKNKYFLILSYFILNFNLIFSQNEIFLNESDYDLEEESDNFGVDLDQMFYKENSCSTEQFINNINFSNFLPHDYESMKNEKISRNVLHINQTYEKFKRLEKWIQKISRNENLRKVFNFMRSRAYEMVYEIDLQPECLSALLRVVTAMQEKKLWALKCNEIF
jgi:hypothetical protein